MQHSQMFQQQVHGVIPDKASMFARPRDLLGNEVGSLRGRVLSSAMG